MSRWLEVRINGLFYLLINGVDWGYNPLILTIDPIFLGHLSDELFGDGLDGSLFRGLGGVGMKHLNIWNNTHSIWRSPVLGLLMHYSVTLPTKTTLNPMSFGFLPEKILSSLIQCQFMIFITMLAAPWKSKNHLKTQVFYAKTSSASAGMSRKLVGVRWNHWESQGH